jgi:hypothetical protein
MTGASNHGHREHEKRLAGSPRRSRPARRPAAIIAALLGLAVLAAGCGGSNNHTPGSSASSGAVTAQFLAYTRCMRSHGVSDFPDPTSSPGGGVGIQINGGPGSDLNPDDPTFKAAKQACRALLPGGEQPPALSAPKIAAEVKWARCMRSHGLPSFPDPNARGAFDSSKFDENSPAFQTAGNACQSLRATGPTPVVP